MPEAPLTRPSLLVRLRPSRSSGLVSVRRDLSATPIYGYVRKRGLQDADAADLTQACLLQVAPRGKSGVRRELRRLSRLAVHDRAQQVVGISWPNRTGCTRAAATPRCASSWKVSRPPRRRNRTNGTANIAQPARLGLRASEAAGRGNDLESVLADPRSKANRARMLPKALD